MAAALYRPRQDAYVPAMRSWTLVWMVVGLAGSLVTMIYYAVLRRAAVSARERPARLAIGRARFIDGATIAELPENSVVRVRGTVRPLGAELRGPLGDRPCVYWRVTAAVQRFSERRGRYGYRHAYWQDSIDHSEGAPFALVDGSAECSVDPALATVSAGKPRVQVIQRGQAMPSRIAVMLAEQGVSLDEIRSETWRFEETMVAVDATVVVVGVGRRADRSLVHGERDYRASQATWVVLDGQELELLITDDKRLLRQGPEAVPTDLDPRERWQGRSVVAPEASLVPLDEYEAQLRGKRRLAWVGVVGGIAFVATAAVAIPAVLRAMRRSDQPTTLTEAQVETLRGLTQQHRVAAYRSDDDWRKALLARDALTQGDAACTRIAALPSDAPIPIATIGGELPPQSPRTTAMLRVLDALDAQFPSIGAEQFAEQRELASHPQVSPLEIWFEFTPESRTIIWLYDHDARRILCRGEPDALGTDRPDVVPRELGALRAVR